MKLSALLEPMVAAGVDAQTILATVRAWEQQQSDALEQRRASDRERQARRRHVTSRDVTVTVASREGVAPVEDKTSLPEKEPQTENKTRNDATDFRDALRAVLDEERLEALVKQRRARKAPVTALAARLFVKAAADCGITVSEAADHCVSRNWLTVKPEWLAKPSPRGSPPAKRGVGSVFGDLVEHLENGQGNDDRGRQAAGSTVLSLPYRRSG